MKQLIIIFLILFAFKTYSQKYCCDYQIKGYAKGDTCMILTAQMLDESHKPIAFGTFDFYCNQRFMDKYAVGKIFNYIDAFYKENYIRIVTPDKREWRDGK